MEKQLHRVLVTGGAGFVGSAVGIALHERLGVETVVCLDNLRRRGSELNISRLRNAGVTFVHGDVRKREDVDACGPVDLIVDCSAEPSVLAGVDGGQRYVVDTNLGGTVNCLELARRNAAGIVFLSTSRVYPHETLGGLHYEETDSRFDLPQGSAGEGISSNGITERFPLTGARSLYGATKLASELLLTEYGESYGLPWVVNRCGVIAGPGQWGKIDQGFMTLWVSRHEYGRPLTYIGFGGSGKQVRDVLHIEDLLDLMLEQVSALDRYDGRVFNVGGGRENSVSLKELTQLCRVATGGVSEIFSEIQSRPNDIPWYVTDSASVTEMSAWRPRRSVATIVDDILRWVRDGGGSVREVLGG